MIIVCLFFKRMSKSWLELPVVQLRGAPMLATSVMSVLTDNEGDGLDDMAEGLMQRYISANIPPPKVLYVDRDCCSTRSKQQFYRFPEILVRLDIWHFMRRLAVACCSESHALYCTFMLHLSGTIFEWDP